VLGAAEAAPPVVATADTKDAAREDLRNKCAALLGSELEGSRVMAELLNEKCPCAGCGAGVAGVLCHCHNAAGSVFCDACDVKRHLDSGVPCCGRYFMDSVDGFDVLRRLYPNEFLDAGTVIWMYLPILLRPIGRDRKLLREQTRQQQC